MAQEQQLTLTEQPPSSEPARRAPQARRPERPVKVIQDVLLEEGFWAVTQAGRHDRIEALAADITANLKQQSQETRTRYAHSIVKWFFPGRVPQSPAVAAWDAYGSKPLTIEILRLLYLRAEPIVGRCVAEFLYPIQENAIVPGSYFDSYLLSSFSDIHPRTRSRLKQNLRKLGFLEKSVPEKDLLRPLNPSPTALFLMFSFYFANTETRTVEMPTVLADPFWKYLGFKSDDAVRRIFRDIANRGLLAKYVVADQLELITAALTFRQCIERKVRV